MPDRSRKWEGGYILKNSQGVDVFYIYKKINGRLFELSTHCNSPSAAKTQWRRFQADPSGYNASGIASDAVCLDADTISLFMTWTRETKKNTKKWTNEQLKCLQWWTKKLGARTDLRKVTTDKIVNALDGVPGRKQRIATLKTFCSWLIKERHRMKPNENPMAGLTVPQSRPEQWTKGKVIPAEMLESVRAKLPADGRGAHWRDGLSVLAATGWHVSELHRFAVGGHLEKHPHSGRPVLVCPRTKGGKMLRTEVDEATAKCGERLVARRKFSERRFYEALKLASVAAGIKEEDYLKPGQMRHTVATWAVNAGAELPKVSAFLNHMSIQTTNKFYATHAVPAKVPTLATVISAPSPEQAPHQDRGEQGAA